MKRNTQHADLFDIALGLAPAPKPLRKGTRGRDFRYDTGRDLGLTSYAIPAAPKGVKVLKAVPQRYAIDADPEITFFVAEGAP